MVFSLKKMHHKFYHYLLKHIENQVFYNKINLCLTLKKGAESENQVLFLSGLGPYALWSVYYSLNFQDILNV